MSPVMDENFLSLSHRATPDSVITFGKIIPLGPTAGPGTFVHATFDGAGTEPIRQYAVPELSTGIWQCRYGPDGARLYYGDRGLRNRYSRAETRTRLVDAAPYADARILPDGSRWALGTRTRNGSSDIYLRRLGNEGPVALPPAPRIPVFRLYPNPSRGGTYLQLLENRTGPLTIALYDAAGGRVWTRQYPKSQTAFDYRLDYAHLAAGTYRCVVRIDGETYSRPLVVLPE